MTPSTKKYRKYVCFNLRKKMAKDWFLDTWWRELSEIMRMDIIKYITLCHFWEMRLYNDSGGRERRTNWWSTRCSVNRWHVKKRAKTFQQLYACTHLFSTYSTFTLIICSLSAYNAEFCLRIVISCGYDGILRYCVCS